MLIHGAGLRGVPALGQGVRAPAYSAEATALIARMNVPPSADRKRLIDGVYNGLRAAGLLQKLDALYILKAHDAQAARLNWVQDLYNATAINSPTFTTDRGYNGDAASSYLSTGFNPTTAPAPKFTQNSAHMSLWSQSVGQASGSNVDGGSANTLMQIRTVSNQCTHRAAGSSSGVINSVTDGSGLFTTSRTDANTNAMYRNAGLLTPSTPAGVSTAPDNNFIRIGGRGGSSAFSDRQFAAASIGSGLTAQNVSDLYSVLNTYMIAVGA